MSLIHDLLRDERGAALAEYALLTALIAVGGIVGVAFVRGAITNVYSRIAEQLVEVIPV